MKYITDAKLVIKSWCNNPEEGTIEQAINLANHPFMFHHVALMPDTHQGYGMPIGGVVGTKGCVIPNAVGVDIGCGMAAVKTSLTELSTERLKEIMTLIRKKVPVGFNKHKEAQDELLMPVSPLIYDSEQDGFWYSICSNEFENAQKQLGTLGGGNHFIEIQKGSDGFIWFMVHSGSRNLGYTVAKHYNKVAEDLNEMWKTSVPKDHGLAFLPKGTEEYDQYLAEMNYCLDFAQANRDLMVERIKVAFEEELCDVCGGNGGKRGKKCEECCGYGTFVALIPDIKFEPTINIHHNYAAMENHFGSNVMIHRKGATSAKEGELGIIPGSQGTSSFIVKGKGNPESFKSCSHGAGRTMSRTKAKKQLNLQDEQKLLEDRGIIHSIRGKDQLDEASSAYKDINVVMDEQKDLVDIVVELQPLGVIKG